MGFRDLVRSGIALADTLTKDMQSEVTLSHATIDFEGTKTYGDPVPMKAIVDWKQRHLRTPGGELTVSRASVLFLDTERLLEVTNGQGIDDNDLIILQDGTTGPILDMGGFIDAGTGIPVATEVFLG